MNNLNLNLLKVFMCVATSNSFLEASKKLYISQPAISKSIKTLEEELNVNLFYRGNKGICLTPDGEILLKYVKEAYNLIEAGERMIGKNNDLSNGSLIIGVKSYIVSSYLLDRISAFRRDYPGIKIKVVDLDSNSLLENLERHNIDFVIDSFDSNINYNNFVVKKIAELNTCFIKNKNYTDSTSDIYAVCKSNLILPSKENLIRHELDACLESESIKLKPILEFSNDRLIIEATSNNLGVGYVIENSVNSLIDSGVVEKINLVFNLPKVEIDLIYTKGYLTKAAKTFIEFLISL